MPSTREMLIELACQRAGLSGTQVDAVRRGDVGALLREGWPGSPRDHSQEIDNARNSLRATTRRLNSVQEQLDAAFGLLNQLADMLGSCVRCWGTNEICPVCRGHGSPGFRHPGDGLLGWIEPALRRLSDSTVEQQQTNSS
jgi:hypothetical protein